TAVISGTTEALEEVFQLTSGELGFTVASALIGTIVGSIAVGRPGETLGSRLILKYLAIFYLVSAVGCAVAWDWYSLLLFRFLGGLAVGGSSVMSPLYIAEVSPARLRGRLVAIAQLNVVLGILGAYFSNFWIAGRLGDSMDAWRWMFGVEAVPAAIFFLLLFWIPESPRWLVKRRRHDEALKVLELMGEPQSKSALAAIVDTLHERTVSLQKSLFRRKYAKPIFLAVAVATFNQLSGINAVIYYTPRIFKLAGASAESALFQSVVIGGTLLLFTAVAMTVIDRLGRRFLLLIGAAGTALCLTSVAYAFHYEIGGTWVLVSLISYIGFFSLSQGTVIWVYLSEIFPNRVRAQGQALGSFTHWTWAAVVSWSFPALAEFSSTVAFSFFALMMALQFVFVWKSLPETRGRSLEQIQTDLGIE
ncbi:MAG TPA: sugar porter family MFS transporter, partial [Acidobacteriota bacterium]|nr:sugar porter family MFS transporter [Acidobacteriota bacterium]